VRVRDYHTTWSYACLPGKLKALANILDEDHPDTIAEPTISVLAHTLPAISTQENESRNSVAAPFKASSESFTAQCNSVVYKESDQLPRDPDYADIIDIRHFMR
jgi:hypothetical protein